MEYKDWLVEYDRKEGSVASKYTEILDKETDLSISYIYKMAHTGAKNQSFYSAYLRFLLWGKSAIPEYISDGHKKRLQTFAARFSESSSSQTSAQSDDTSFGPIISFRDFLERLTNIDDNIFLDPTCTFRPHKKAYRSSKETDYLAKRYIVLNNWNNEISKKEMVNKLVSFLTKEYPNDKTVNRMRSRISEDAQKLYDTWEEIQGFQGSPVCVQLLQLSGVKKPNGKEERDYLGKAALDGVRRYVAEHLIQLFVELLNAVEDDFGDTEAINCADWTLEQYIFSPFQNIRSICAEPAVSKNACDSTSGIPDLIKKLLFSNTFYLSYPPKARVPEVRLIYHNSQYINTNGKPQYDSIWGNENNSKAIRYNLTHLLAIMFSQQQSHENLNPDLFAVYPVLEQILDSAPKDRRNYSQLVSLLIKVNLFCYLAQLSSCDIKWVLTNCRKIIDLLCTWCEVLDERLWRELPNHAVISDSLPEVCDVRLFMAKKLMEYLETSGYVDQSTPQHYDAIVAEYYAVQSRIGFEQRGDKLKEAESRLIRAKALIVQSAKMKGFTCAEQLEMDYSLPVCIELRTVWEIINQSSITKTPLYELWEETLGLYKNNLIPNIVNADNWCCGSNDLTDLSLAELESMPSRKIKMDRGKYVEARYSQSSAHTFYLAELDSVNIIKNPDEAEARLMALLLRGPVVLTLPQLVDSPLRKLAYNQGFIRLLKKGQLSISLYNNFYSLREYAAVQMEGTFWWSSFSKEFNENRDARIKAAKYLRNEHVTDVPDYVVQLKETLSILDELIPYSHRVQHYQFTQDIFYADAIEVSYGALENSVMYSDIRAVHTAVMDALTLHDVSGNKRTHNAITRSHYLDMLKCFGNTAYLTKEQAEKLTEAEASYTEATSAAVRFIADDTYNRMLSSFCSDRQIFSYSAEQLRLLRYGDGVPVNAKECIKYRFLVTQSNSLGGMNWDDLCDRTTLHDQSGSFITYTKHNGEEWPTNMVVSVGSGKAFSIQISFDTSGIGASDNNRIFVETNGFVKRSPQWKRYLYLMAQYPDYFLSKAPNRLYAKLDAEEKAAAALGKEVQLGVIEETEDWLLVREWNGSEITDRIVYLNKETELRIKGYFDLVASRHDLFIQSERHYPICLDEQEMLRFEKNTEKNKDKKKVGLLVSNHPYWIVVADLICPRSKDPFVYQRVVPYSGGGSVILPVWKGPKGIIKFGLLNNFRHSLRNFVLELPRGHQTEGLSSEENAKKEICEELNVSRDQITGVLPLGKVMPDSGLTASEVSLFAAEIIGEKPPAGNIGHEGIEKLLWVDLETLEGMIVDGRIGDCFTIAAYTRYMLKQNKT